MGAKTGAKPKTRRMQLIAGAATLACLALWTSGIRVHVNVHLERRAVTSAAAARTARALRDLSGSAQPQLKSAASQQPASAAAGVSVFAREPGFDQAADPFAQIPGFDRSTLSTGTLKPQTVTFSQSLEDLYVWDHFFYKMVSGVFLEMGALDGVTYSNTFILEKWAGWTGVLIEPGPQNYANLQQNRPRSACVNAAVCNHHSTVHFVERHAVGGIWEFMTPEFRRVWHPDVAAAQLPAISCFPLSSILTALGVDHLNFWSLDVEGAEFEVLQTFDFKQVRVDVMVVEAWPDDQNAAKNLKAEALILAGGMKLYNIETNNRWYVREGFVASRTPVLVDLERKRDAAVQAGGAA